jgi:hypothetical protein
MILITITDIKLALMNDHTIYRGTGIQESQSMIAWLNIALFKENKKKGEKKGKKITKKPTKQQDTHFKTEEPVLSPSQFKG